MAGAKQASAGQGVTPYLIVADAAAAIDFYRAVFGAEERFRLTDPQGRVSHAEIAIGASTIMLADEHPDFGALAPAAFGGSPVKLHVQVDDADAVVARAAEAGATVLRPVKDEFYGERTGMIADPFGHAWYVATPKEAVGVEEMQRRWSETFAV